MWLIPFSNVDVKLEKWSQAHSKTEKYYGDHHSDCQFTAEVLPKPPVRTASAESSTVIP